MERVRITREYRNRGDYGRRKYCNHRQTAATNEEMAEYLRTHNTKLLDDVLYTSSNLMHNSFAMSDRWN